MNQLLSQAINIAKLHQRAKVPALVAEQMLLDLGFHSIAFDKHGLASAKYLGVTYELREARDAAR